MQINTVRGALLYAKSVLRVARKAGITTWREFTNRQEEAFALRQSEKRPLSGRDPQQVLEEAMAEIGVVDGSYSLRVIEQKLEDRFHEVREES